MLTDVVLSCDGKRPQPVIFESIFDFQGKKNLKKVKSLSAVADMSSMSLSYLGDIFPGLQILRLDRSLVSSVRDLRAELPLLRVLSLAHCGITSLRGIAAVCPRAAELYLGFNAIDDISDVIGLARLKVLDLEANAIAAVGDAGYLRCCPKLRGLVLRGNPADEHPDYRAEVKRAIPLLRSLDGVNFGEEPVPEAVVPTKREPLPPIGDEPAPGDGVEAPPGTARKRQTIVPAGRVARPTFARQKVWYNKGSIRL
jgi:hypothetical protein